MKTFLESITTKTPDGDFHMIIDEDEVVRVSGFGDIEKLRTRLPEDLIALHVRSRSIHPYQKMVEDYYSGNPVVLDEIPRAQTGTHFRERVWNEITAVPYGKTLSYKELAVKSDNKAAIRAAGTICGLNKLILLVPCHRILKSDGTIGSYLYGSAIKAALLERERRFSSL